MVPVRKWLIQTESVIGPSHTIQSLPNQDAIFGIPGTNTVVAMADGHGSPKCFRSSTGAQEAVGIALQLMNELLDQYRTEDDLRNLENSLIRQLRQRMVSQWGEKIAHHLEQNPFTEQEWQSLVEQENSAARESVEKNPRIAYGSTILAAGVSENIAVFFQLGDGDILLVNNDNEIRRPLPSDPSLIGNLTTSLSTENATNCFRTSYRLHDADRVKLILLATDGYSNSFRSDDGFLQAARDFAALVSTREGEVEVQNSLKVWLQESAEQSGDDVSVGLIYPAPEG
ncbi:MAG: protein phosphatase 2C domain-containing protein [Planctomycetaceae bacterium]|nr:protein phosphatase 2C domain-containing protein [Planctomycetaceae bacterium]